jgi:ParB family chromosome partitioning protein
MAQPKRKSAALAAAEMSGVAAAAAKVRRLRQGGSSAVHPIHMIPLDLLCLSERNVRKTGRDAHIASLADDIAANGLKQNLVVISEGIIDPGNGQMPFQVVAGGRRFQALRLLADRGDISPVHEVPCLIELAREAVATSLSENLHKVAMNPADEFDAFNTIAGQLMMPGPDSAGMAEAEAVAACARRFGRSVRHVEGRLRLAALHPDILQALREDRLGLESAKAYGAVSDQALQLAVFKEREKINWADKHAPNIVRDLLRQKTYPVDCRAMLFVGIAAYLAEGGRTETELFMGERAQEVVLDTVLLNRLANEKAEGQIAGMAAIEGWARGLLQSPFGKGAAKPPKGYEAHSYYGNQDWKAPEKLTDAERAQCIGLFDVRDVWSDSEDGDTRQRTGIELGLVDRAGCYFRPLVAGEEKPRTGYTPPTPEEIRARKRESFAALHAARLAVPKFAGTPLEGRAFWPLGRFVEPLSEGRSDGKLFVTVLIEVDEVDAKAQRDAAHAAFDQREAAEQAEEARIAALRESGQDDDDGADDQDGDDGDALEEEEKAA